MSALGNAIAAPDTVGASAAAKVAAKSGKAATRAQGRKAQRAGARAESDVDAVCARYLRVGWADVLHVGPPMAVTGTRGGAPVWRAVGKGGPDYEGVVLGYGIARALTGIGVAFEVKRSSTARLPLDTRGGPTLKPHQRAVIVRRHDAGCIAGVLVMLTTRDGPAWWWVSAAQWCALEDGARAAGRASVSAADFDAHCTRCHMLAVGPDWLRAAVE